MIPDVELFLWLTGIILVLVFLIMLIGAAVGSIKRWNRKRKNRGWE